MKNKISNLISEPDFTEKLYGWAYNRARDKRDAEDICHNIVVELLLAERKHVEAGWGYVWQIAANTLVDFYGRGKREERRSYELSEVNVNVLALSEPGFEERMISEIERGEQLDFIMREITLMSKIYREVMVMFYIDGLGIAEIAARLAIPENRVKQRLFSAKEKIRKETHKMTDNNISRLKPVKLWLPGNGNPLKSDLRDKVRSSLVQNICYACRSKAKSAAELADELGVPAYYIEDAAESALGEPLKKTESGKYIANFIIIDMKVQETVSRTIAGMAAELASKLKDYFDSNREMLENVKLLGLRQSLNDLLWALIPSTDNIICGFLLQRVTEQLKKRGYVKEERDFYVLGEALREGESAQADTFYSQNGNGNDKMYINNFIGRRLPYSMGNRFDCYEKLPPQLDIICDCVGGFDPESLDDNGKAAAAEAIKCGYIKLFEGKYYPDILFFESSSEFWRLLDGAESFLSEAADRLCDGYLAMIDKYVPAHLLGQADNFASLTLASRHYIIEEALRIGLLKEVGEGSTAGVFAIARKPQKQQT